MAPRSKPSDPASSQKNFRLQAEIRAACSRKALGRLTADGESHALHPIPHGAAERDLAAAGADGLGLQVKQDHPGASAVGNAEKLGLAAVLHPAGFDQKGDLVPLLFPRMLVGKPLVGQAVRQKPV